MVASTPSTDIDLVKYKESLISFLQGQDRFKDYDFRGSNFDALLTLLAYNAYNMAHYDGMVGNEAWIDTAELRQSLVSHATDLNYLPRSMTSAQAILEVEIFPNDAPVSITLPKYYRFKSSDTNGNNISFVTDKDYIAVRSEDGRYVFNDVYVYQGEITEEFFLAQGIIQENGSTIYQIPFVLASENIDIKSLEVFVAPTEGDPNRTKYTYARTLSETTNQSRTFFIRGIYDNQYSIEFGDGTFGAPLSNGNQVIARYRNTQGNVIQGNYILSKTSDISGYSEIVVNSATRVQGGFARESVEQIRFNAPRYFQIQDRAVTATDYEGLIKANFPNIQQVSVFGGEEVEQYGKVFIVLKPYGIIGTVSNQIKSQIIQLLKEKNIVPEPIVIDPEYFYVGITGNVTFSGDLLTITEPQLKANIINQLVALNDDETTGIGDFNSTLYQSLVNSTIRGCNKSIIGSDVVLDLRKRWTPALNLNETLTITSNNTFHKSRDGQYSNPNDYTLISSVFNVFINERISQVVIQDDGIGNLFYFFVDSSSAKSKSGNKVGTIDYDRGSVNLTANVYEYNNYIEFIIRLNDKSLNVNHNSFLLLDANNIDLTLKRK